jgi:hypothetical protein
MGGRYLLVMIAAVAAWSSLVGPAAGGQLATRPKPRNVVAVINLMIRDNSKNTEIVAFGDRRLPPVKVVRGKNKPISPPVTRGTTDSVAFADKRMQPVQVMRGAGRVPVAYISLALARPLSRPTAAKAEIVVFAGRGAQPVTVLRGTPVAAINLDLFAAARGANFDLFSAARGADLDRVAFAVDGAESRHGADPGMWRPELDGPQGPMQVSAAAATDSGGGDRFDLTQNRLLGRAYLARLYRRYGNWPDAIAAYNWGPGNLDEWIGAGRPAAGFPLEVERYRDRVLRDGGIPQMVGAALSAPGWRVQMP